MCRRHVHSNAVLVLQWGHFHGRRGLGFRLVCVQSFSPSGKSGISKAVPSSLASRPICCRPFLMPTIISRRSTVSHLVGQSLRGFTFVAPKFTMGRKPTEDRMKHLRGDIWELAEEEAKTGFVAVCVTTNGRLRGDGRAVMGRGIAQEAKARFPGVDIVVGENIVNHGNRVARLGRNPRYDLVMFPTKHDWRDKADPALITRSAHDLERLADEQGWDVVLLPRPGCGNGGLDWANVEPLIDFLDDRFYEVTF